MIVGRLGISYAQAGLLNSLSGMIHIVVQPMAGYISDTFSRPYAIIVGPLLTALGASMLPLGPTYGVTLILVGLWSFGSSVYHPLGHGSVGYVGDPGKLAFFLALFSVAGILGSTLSPIYAVLLVKLFGLGPLMVAAALFTPEASPAAAAPAGRRPFVWGADDLFARLERDFDRARELAAG